ncbi:unnamed protein product [Knipowitschia caucasica]
MTSVGPVYFFDQPRRIRNKGRRTNLDLGMRKEEWQTENKNQRVLSGEEQEEDSPELSSLVFSLKEQDVMDTYKHKAPQLLSELAHVLSQHKWSAEGRVPHGLVNILYYTWQEQLPPAPQHQKSLTLSNIDLSPQSISRHQKREVAIGQAKPQVRTSASVKKKSIAYKESSRSSTSLSFSILNQSSSDQGSDCIIQQHHTSCFEDIYLYKWAAGRLQEARNTTASLSEHNRSILLRHYGDPQRVKSDWTKARLGVLLNGLPQIPDWQPPENQQKLHYRINDGSSIIYYPSGRMAVCQSCSGQPPGGFYSNVFSDSDPPLIIATITAFGHGSVMPSRSSSAMSAVWDRAGGFMFDHKGKGTKEWSWTAGFSKRIVIGISEEMTLHLLSGTSAVLKFKCAKECVQLPISALPNSNTFNTMLCLKTDTQFSSDTAQDLLSVPSPVVCSDNNRTETCVSSCSWYCPHAVRAPERPEDTVSVWRKEGKAVRELRKIQQRAQCILESWMDLYCVATGIRCPNMQWMPDVPPRSRLKREVQLAALPSLNLSQRTNPEPQKEEQHKLLPRPKHQNRAPSPPRPQTKNPKEDHPITRIGPVQFYGCIKRESVILPVDPDQQTTSAPHPVQLPSSPSGPLTHCPVLLRAALSGDITPRRCCCSALTMPLVKDSEYDLFVLGQPRHSHQMLIVWVTCQNLNPDALGRAAPEKLYRTRNKHRMMPCTQCQMDSFRLVRYDIAVPKPCYEAEKCLLQQRHNACPDMVLMYIKGKLLFIDYIDFNDLNCPFKEFENKVSKARGDYRSGVFLSSDFKFRDRFDTVTKVPSSWTIREKKGSEMTLSQSKRDNFHKPKKTLSSSTLSQSIVHTQ